MPDNFIGTQICITGHFPLTNNKQKHEKYRRKKNKKKISDSTIVEYI